jgi:hypothetical protein
MCCWGVDSGDEFARGEGKWGTGAADVCVAEACAREIITHNPHPQNKVAGIESKYTSEMGTREFGSLLFLKISDARFRETLCFTCSSSTSFWGCGM